MNAKTPTNRFPKDAVEKIKDYLDILNEIGEKMEIPTFQSVWPKDELLPDGDFIPWSDILGAADKARGQIDKLLEALPLLRKYVFRDDMQLTSFEEWQRTAPTEEVFTLDTGEVISYDPVETILDINEGEERTYYLEVADSRLREIASLRASLFTLAKENTQACLKRIKRGNEKGRSSNTKFRLAVTATVGLDADGFFTLIHSEFLELVAQRKITASRIRLCDNCNCERIFWAERRDSIGCSARCSAAIRQARWRRSDPERYTKQQKDYNEKRLANYAYKKNQSIRKKTRE